jgi:hypothetical protein
MVAFLVRENLKRRLTFFDEDFKGASEGIGRTHRFAKRTPAARLGLDDLQTVVYNNEGVTFTDSGT